MNRIIAPLALVTSAVLVACSSPTHRTTPPPAPTTSTTATTSAAPTTSLAPTTAPTLVGQPSATQLKAMALATSDLPFGWAVSPPSTDSSVTSPCSAITSDAGKQLPAQAETDYQQSEDGPFLQEILAAGATRQVHAVWASIQTAASKCSAQASTATPGGDSTHLSRTPFPSYGDESYALQLTAERSGVSYSGDVVVIRKGQVFIEVVVFGGGGVPTSLVQQTVDRAMAKL